MNENGSNMPDQYDRQLSTLHDLPDVIHTPPRTVRVVPPLGVGGSTVYIVQTYRQSEVGDTAFLEVAGTAGLVRVVLPPAVTAALARQRDSLTDQSRSRAAKRTAADRKARGLKPGFMVKRRKGGAK